MSDINSNELVPCKKGKIIIVDDEEQIRGMFKMFLEMDLPEADIEVACNGQEAVEKFIESHHAVILMDLHMPIMDGIEAFREIEDHCMVEKWEVPVIVFCTAYDPPSAAGIIMDEYPNSSLIRKPVSQDALVETVKKALSE